MAPLARGKRKVEATKSSNTDNQKKKSELGKRSGKSLSKSSTLKNFSLAMVVGSIPFIATWFLVGAYLSFECPFNFMGEETWDFFSKLISAFIISAIVLKIADLVAEQKGKYSKGVPKAFLLTLIIFVFWFYGYDKSYQKDQIKKDEVEEVVKDSNPYSDMSPAFIFTLDAGEETTLFNHKAGFRMLTYGDKHDYKIMYKDGPVINVIDRVIRKTPNLDSRDYKVKIRSNVDRQTIYVYYKRS
jgi:hypothetical protein